MYLCLSTLGVLDIERLFETDGGLFKAKVNSGGLVRKCLREMLVDVTKAGRR